MRADHRRAAARSAWLLLAVSIVVVAIAATVLLRGGGSNDEQATSAPLDQPSTPAPTTPAEPRASDSASATAPVVPPEPPRRLVLRSLGINMPVVPVGVSADGLMRMPDHPSTIGWYRFGPAPGAEHGSAVLAGHVDSKKYGVGPLANLRRLQPGDRVVVVDGGGRTERFRVDQTQVIEKQTLALDKVFARSGGPVLRILTCGGPYLPDQGGYQDNVVVTAVPLA